MVSILLEGWDAGEMDVEKREESDENIFSIEKWYWRAWKQVELTSR